MIRADVLSRGRAVVGAQLAALVWIVGRKEPWGRVDHAAGQREDTADGVGERSLSELEEDFAPFLGMGHVGSPHLAAVYDAADPAADPMGDAAWGNPARVPDKPTILPSKPCLRGHTGRWAYQLLKKWWCVYCLECKRLAYREKKARRLLREALPLVARRDPKGAA
mgnify:CR=1 FL=1